MIQKLPQMVSVAELHNKYRKVIERLSAGPVVVANAATPEAVMVAPALWDELVEALGAYEDLVVARERQIEAKSNPAAMRPISQLRASLEADGLLDD